MDQFLKKEPAQKQKNPGQLTDAYRKHRDSMMMIRQGLTPPDLPAWALTSVPGAKPLKIKEPRRAR